MWHHSIYSQQLAKVHGSSTSFQPLKDMQPLPLKGAPPFPVLVSFFFTKFCFGLLALTVHGFVNLLPMGSLKNFNSILLKFVFNTFII
jgi:hypothetical protein